MHKYQPQFQCLLADSLTSLIIKVSANCLLRIIADTALFIPQPDFLILSYLMWAVLLSGSFKQECWLQAHRHKRCNFVALTTPAWPCVTGCVDREVWWKVGKGRRGRGKGGETKRVWNMFLYCFCIIIDLFSFLFNFICLFCVKQY